MPSEIKPCPACSGPSEYRGEPHDPPHYVECVDGCGMEGPCAGSQEEAIAKWNRLHMLPDGKPGTWMERAHEYTEACLTACEGLNPEALGEFVAAVEEFSEESEQHWRECRDKVRAALAKLKGGG